MSALRDAPRFTVTALDLFERDVVLRLPFRFGATTLQAAPQAFVRAQIERADGRSAEGWTAELMVPKWFDKSPGRTPADRHVGVEWRRSLSLPCGRNVAWLSTTTGPVIRTGWSPWLITCCRRPTRSRR